MFSRLTCIVIVRNYYGDSKMPSEKSQIKSCEKCGQEFACGANEGGTCWCFNLGPLDELPYEYKECLCPDCLKDFLKSEPTKSPSPNKTPSKLKEGRDYYLENGFMVFTEQYHLDREYCCGNGCRHCPY